MQGEIVELRLAIAVGAGQLQVQAVAERALPVAQPLQRQLVLAGGGQAAGLGMTPEQGEQIAGLLQQPLRAHHHAVVAMAFQPAAAEQARQVEVALVAAAQQRDREGRLAAAGDHHVGAGERLDPGGLRLGVEFHQREQVVAVGDGDRRLAQGSTAIDEPRDADRRIDQRVLAVQVEVDEAC